MKLSFGRAFLVLSLVFAAIAVSYILGQRSATREATLLVSPSMPKSAAPSAIDLAALRDEVNDRASDTAVALPQSPDADGYLARIQINSPDEVGQALERAEELYQRGVVSQLDDPLAIVLHGPEVSMFLKSNYEEYQAVVDLAAKLTALNVVDVKVCRTRLGVMGESEESLVPFVESVPYGLTEIDRLINQEGYVYF